MLFGLWDICPCLGGPWFGDERGVNGSQNLHFESFLLFLSRWFNKMELGWAKMTCSLHVRFGVLLSLHWRQFSVLVGILAFFGLIFSRNSYVANEATSPTMWFWSYCTPAVWVYNLRTVPSYSRCGDQDVQYSWIKALKLRLCFIVAIPSKQT